MISNFAFVFPGQGSQSVGMLDAWGDHPIVRATLQEASDSIDQDLFALIKQGPKEELALTTNTQPVMLAAGVAAYRVWINETGLQPQFVAGHSLGEYSALVASEVLSLTQAVPLVKYRAQAMQEAVPIGMGAMAAILGMPSHEVVRHCKEISSKLSTNSMDVVEAVNFNDMSQTVIAGSKIAVDQACEVLKSNGAKRAILIPVSAPFHSSLMKPAAEKLRVKLDELTIGESKIPLINNIDVSCETEGNKIKDALYRQAFGAVRWVECIQAMKNRDVQLIVESGPGKVLTGMVKRIDVDLLGLGLFDLASLDEVKKTVGES